MPGLRALQQLMYSQLMGALNTPDMVFQPIINATERTTPLGLRLVDYFNGAYEHLAAPAPCRRGGAGPELRRRVMRPIGYL